MKTLTLNHSGLRRRARRAFTLIELLLVMVIIAILAAVVVPKYAGQAQKAKVKAAQADISTIGTQLRAYEVTNEKFPTSEEGLQPLVDAKLLEKVPVDPWGHPYVYRSTADGFDLYSMGPNGQDDNQGGDDVTINGQAAQ